MSALPNLLDTFTPDEWAEHDAELEQERIEYAKRKQAANRAELQTFANFAAYNAELLKAAKASKIFTAAALSGAFRSIAILGNNGTGKTHLLRAIANETSARCVTTFELVDAYSRSRSFESEVSEAELITRYVHPRCLLIDEVGRSSRPELEKEALFRIIDARTEAGKSFAFASNMRKAELAGFLGSAITSRLNVSLEVAELFNTDDYRKRQRVKA